MCASKKQIKANRQNAKKSTGPITESGKNISSQNSVVHGLYSENIIVNSPHYNEDRLQYTLLLESLREEFEPTSYFQEILIQKIANCIWRCRRAIAAETAIINKQLHRIKESVDKIRLMEERFNMAPEFECKNHELFNNICQKLLPTDKQSQLILRYEMRIDRQLSRFYKLLKHTQLADSLQELKRSKHKCVETNPISYNSNSHNILDDIPEFDRTNT